MKWDSKLYDHTHHFVSQYGSSLIDLLQPQDGESVLDIGCGTGDLAYELTQKGCKVTGIDASAEMIASAKEKFPNLELHQAQATDFELNQSFDSVFSNATLHWIPAEDHPQVLQQISKHLKPGGRFVAEFGGENNIVKIREALREVLEKRGFSALAETDNEIWYFPRTEVYKNLLTAAGFTVTSITDFERPTPLFEGYKGLRKWLTMFGDHWFEGLDYEVRDDLITEVERYLEPELFQNGRWIADYVRLRFSARQN